MARKDGTMPRGKAVADKVYGETDLIIRILDDMRKWVKSIREGTCNDEREAALQLRIIADDAGRVSHLVAQGIHALYQEHDDLSGDD